MGRAAAAARPHTSIRMNHPFNVTIQYIDNQLTIMGRTMIKIKFRAYLSATIDNSREEELEHP